MPASQHEDVAPPVSNGNGPAEDLAADIKAFDDFADYAPMIQAQEQLYEDNMANSNFSHQKVPSDATRTSAAHGNYENGYTTGSHDLPRLQAHGNLDGGDRLDPVLEDDPSSYDLVAPGDASVSKDEYSLEKRSQLLFSKEHLQVIFSDPASLFKFTTFLSIHHPKIVPILVHYLDALKALRAIHYANAILQGLDAVEELDVTKQTIPATRNQALEARATAAFEYLVKETLPAYVTHSYIRIVSASISARVTGMLSPDLREASEGLAEVFCLTDPSRPDNPIVFASEEFNRTTQYGMSYILGRNCRFLQGPFTNPLSVRRLRESIAAGKQHQEVFLNYRRDGSPFMNLLMTAPLCDSRGRVRYFIGAQVDVTGLVRDCAELESFQYLLDLKQRDEAVPDPQKPSVEKNDELGELAEMFNMGELSTIRRNGGKMHRDGQDDDNDSIGARSRLLLRDPTINTAPVRDVSGKLSGVYQHYLLVRPYPALRILFASPSQRVPGILQSPLMNKIGGSNRVREELTAALAEGRGVTAKVRWISKGDEEGRNKWIHCTPLLGTNGQVGVWMIVIVDDEKRYIGSGRQAPPVSTPERSFTPTGRQRGGSNSYSSEHRNGQRSTEGGSVNSFRIS